MSKDSTRAALCKPPLAETLSDICESCGDGWCYARAGWCSYLCRYLAGSITIRTGYHFNLAVKENRSALFGYLAVAVTIWTTSCLWCFHPLKTVAGFTYLVECTHVTLPPLTRRPPVLTPAGVFGAVIKLEKAHRRSLLLESIRR